MALSVYTNPCGIWPLGCVTVTTPGTPVCIMSLVDPNNNNSPNTAVGWGAGAGAAYAPAFHKLFYQGFHPGAGNNGMVINSGQVYLLVAGAGGPGNRSDSGAMIDIVLQGSGGTWPTNEMDLNTVSPYFLFVDADVAGDGLLLRAQR